jgi:chitinase
MDLGRIAAQVDWINIMSYDYHGGWESSGPTNHISALFPSACESEYGDWTDKAVKAYVDAGVDPSQLLLGVPFYGRGWRAASVGDGLCVTASGIPRGTYEKGVDDYEALAAKARASFEDEATGTHWDFDGSQFWSYDDPRSAGWKADYANCRGLRGVMFWELSGDDPSSTLLKSLANRATDEQSGCHDVWKEPPAP